MLVLVTAMVISMALIPLAARMAPAVGMIDRPDARKVHAVPIPRVGGIGIVIGALVPMVLVAEADDLSVAFAIGGVALLLIGAWDDVEALDPYVKLLGQIVAAALVVYYGDLYVRYFPFLGHDPLPAWIGQPFTVFALVGAINALNTSDGLDGLAGGESVLSLAGVTYLAYQADGVSALMLAAATIGGVFGFLRYNSHPARVFMGDSG
ncbi:MAG: undecaprenyl/decaprenyl-phosphate alpha-N-acetylglucosaminyl 1-phosphate transferase, partial [Gammaproteobacteria bacterium]|nr:undecaprenyl/decaprenyl-phosphate alpha-N-acetylglucosaminyl 1-phosphate transferase [Gammaproteobacteria bacterium]NIR85235.1 undecaprenyl/decaprenyl-phosphate alpha-N-acetylglucosaminyl 1-phosphate transferase [Gammaproteobacteria bacterium]